VAIAPQISLLKVQLPAVRASEKITFDISHVSPDGVAGGRSLSYEFCIPATDEHLAEVLAIDPTIYHFRHSRGRIGCQRNQYLCIGSTHNQQWREILLAIARLDYVQRIDEFFGE
ncbi:MAG TPA: hypothetical protein V6C78_28885, partial [Crinalium sp.]